MLYREKIRVSIVIPVLDSHEVLRRQFLNFELMGVPDDVEVIIVDDGSDPPLAYEGKLPVRMHVTNDTRPWTWALARNAGARIAQGKYLLMYDVDHFITRNLLDYVRAFNGQKIQFLREFAILDGAGRFVQDLEALVKYGFPRERYKTRRFKLSPLPNNFAMRRDVFWELGGYREDLVERAYPQGEDRLFKKAWYMWEEAGKGKVHHERPTMYMFPNGYFCGDVDYNPFGLFHKLTRATLSNHKYLRRERNEQLSSYKS